MQKKDEEKKPAKKILFTTDGTKVPLNGYCMYFLRTSTKRNLGEETFQVNLGYQLLLGLNIVIMKFSRERLWLGW